MLNFSAGKGSRGARCAGAADVAANIINAAIPARKIIGAPCHDRGAYSAQEIRRAGGAPCVRDVACYGGCFFCPSGALAVATAVFGYQLYQERQKSGIEISVGKSGISIEKK